MKEKGTQYVKLVTKMNNKRFFDINLYNFEFLLRIMKNMFRKEDDMQENL
jgi:hypothetical protein